MKEKPFGYLRLKSGKFFYDVEGVPNLGEPSSGYIAMYTETQLDNECTTWRISCEDWFKRTDWVQERKDWPFPTLGMHRADVMKKYIDHLEAQVQAQPVQPAGAQELVAWLFSDCTWSPIKAMGKDHNGKPVYFAPPAAAINEQLLEALKIAKEEMIMAGFLTIPEVDTAIAAAESEKAKGGR